MPATGWTANEVRTSAAAEGQLELGLIPTPFLSDARRDADGNFIRYSYDVAGRDSIVVAQRGNRRLAIEFLKWMAETENALIFPRNVKGLTLAMRYDFEYILNEENGFVNDQWDRDLFTILKETQNTSSIGQSPNPIFIQRLVSQYPDNNFFTRALAEGLTVQSAFDTNWTNVQRQWDMWQAAAGLS